MDVVWSAPARIQEKNKPLEKNSNNDGEVQLLNTYHPQSPRINY